MNLNVLHRNNRQKGLALVLAIGFLAILSILGAVVLEVATRDLSDSALTLPNQQAFHAADRSIEYAMNRDVVVNLPQYNSVNLVTDTVIKANGIPVPGVTHKMIIDAAGVGRLISGSLTDLGPRALPPSLASVHGSEFGANLYHATVKTEAGFGPLKRTTHIDANIVRLFKMDDDQIFRTSGGG